MLITLGIYESCVKVGVQTAELPNESNGIRKFLIQNNLQ